MRIKQGFRLRSVGQEHIVTGEGLQQINFNKLIALNSTAAYLWQAVETKEFDVQALSALLTEKYHITPGDAMSDAGDIAEQWIKAGIVEV